MDKHSEAQQYYFFAYAYQIYAHPLLRMIVKKLANGRTLPEKRYVLSKLTLKQKKVRVESDLLCYLFLVRREKDGYITNLIKEMLEDIDLTDFESEKEQHLLALSELLEDLELPPLENEDNFNKNIQEFFVKPNL